MNYEKRLLVFHLFKTNKWSFWKKWNGKTFLKKPYQLASHYLASQKIIHQDKKETAKCGFLLDEALDLKLELTNSCNGTINGRYTQWSNKMAHYVCFLVIFSIIYFTYQVLFELFTWSLLQISIIVIKARIE